MSYEILDILIVLAPFLFFILIWIGSLQLVSFISGWKRLYSQLGSHATPQVIGESSQTFRFQSGKFNKANYKNCLSVNTTRYALILKLFYPFSFGHKPLVIPWAKVQSITAEKLFFYRFVRLKLIAPFNAEIILPEKIFLNNSHLPGNLSLTSSSKTHENPYQ